MAQLNLYIQDDLLKVINSLAKASKKSISAWVRSKLEEVIAEEWPANYFKHLDEMKNSAHLHIPEEVPFSKGAKQEEF